MDRDQQIRAEALNRKGIRVKDFTEGAKWADAHIDLRKLDHITEQLKNHKLSVDYYLNERSGLIAERNQFDSDRRIFLTALHEIYKYNGPSMDAKILADKAAQALLKVEI